MKRTSKKENPSGTHSVMWRILFIIAMVCVVAIVEIVIPSKYHVGVMFVIGWWSSLVWDMIFH